MLISKIVQRLKDTSSPSARPPKYFHRKKKQRLDSKALDDHCINGSVHGSSRHQYHRRSPGSTISRRNCLRSIVENGDSEYSYERTG